MASIFEGLSFQSLENVSPGHDRLRSIQIYTAEKCIPSIVQQIVPFWQSSAFRCQGTTKRLATCPCYSRGGITAIGPWRKLQNINLFDSFSTTVIIPKRKKNVKKHNESSRLFWEWTLFPCSMRWTFESFPRILRSLVESDRFLFPKK